MRQLAPVVLWSSSEHTSLSNRLLERLKAFGREPSLRTAPDKLEQKSMTQPVYGQSYWGAVVVGDADLEAAATRLAHPREASLVFTDRLNQWREVAPRLDTGLRLVTLLRLARDGDVVVRLNTRASIRHRRLIECWGTQTSLESCFNTMSTLTSVEVRPVRSIDDPLDYSGGDPWR